MMEEPEYGAGNNGCIALKIGALQPTDACMDGVLYIVGTVRNIGSGAYDTTAGIVAKVAAQCSGGGGGLLSMII